MRLVKVVLAGVVMLLVLLVIVGLLLPRRAHMVRSISIDSPQSTVFTLVNGFHAFERWSPWHEKDPAMQYELTGPAAGVGAGMRWQSAVPEVGSGAQEIVESRPFSRLETVVDFGAPGTARTAFDIEDNQEGSRVTWSLDIDFGYHLPGRYFGLFLDDVAGPDYERGLERLKALAESLPEVDFSDADIELVQTDSVRIAYKSASASPNPTAIIAALAVAYVEVTAFMELNGVTRQGPPLAIIRYWGPASYEFDAAIPVSHEAAKSKNSVVQLGDTYAGRAVKAVHVGPYKTRARTHEQVQAFMAARGLEQDGDPWEEYVSDPGKTPSQELITHIYYPIR